ncbi:DNA polymerase III subunit delta [Candidatus Berkelbacteria bacterium]|nr:DNA polymerase III subunit delta [Candidatus Berkelbacteria bacterium]
MLLFFYGQDGYRSFAKLRDLKRKYVDASLGDTNLSQLDCTKVTPDALASQLLAMPFLAKTRLVVLDQLLSKGAKAVQEKFTELIEKLPDTTVAVVYEPGIPDRRTVLFKTLVKAAKVQEFAPLVGAQLARWIDELLAPHEARIEPKARAELMEMTSGDSWRIATELQKLATYLVDAPVAQRVITSDLLEQMVRSAPTTSIFALTDALASGDPTQTLRVFHRLTAAGENAQYLLAMVGSTLRTLILIRDSLDSARDKATPAMIAQMTGLKPFVISKNLMAAKQRTLGDLCASLTALVDLDLATKTGRIDADVGLELFVVQEVTQPQNLSQKRAEVSASFSE